MDSGTEVKVYSYPQSNCITEKQTLAKELFTLGNKVINLPHTAQKRKQKLEKIKTQKLPTLQQLIHGKMVGRK